MKIKWMFLLLTVGLMSSCGSDDCTQDDWVGTYTGTETCDGVESAEETFTITAGSTETTLVIDGETVAFDGCNVTESFTFEFLGITTTSEITVELDGNTITGTSKITVDGTVEDDCTFSYTK
jgi:uncharacterized Zn-binding protein involved in type VI secretion